MKVSRKLLIAACIILLLGAGGYAYYRSLYPYGHTHKCSKGLFSVLMSYAKDHDGNFPVAEGDVAPMSLLIPDYADVYLISGKTVDADVAQAFYDKHGYLTKDLCGWHYVEGLAMDAPTKLAICWDPSGLDHNGMRREHKSYEVIFLNGGVEMIPEERWQAFLEQQAAMLEEWRKKQNADGK